jgi:RNA polymerase sigma factor (TIGR02999 family)
MSEITQWLQAAGTGDTAALGRVFEQLYPELRRIARARLDAGERTLTPTVLVHEAFLRLIGNRSLSLSDRRHFLACAAKAMRAVVVDHARRRTAAKRGGPQADLALDGLGFELAGANDDARILALDEALQRLDAINPRQREVVEMRYFAGLEFTEVAELMDCSERTAKREWERARAFLHAQIDD